MATINWQPASVQSTSSKGNPLVVNRPALSPSNGSNPWFAVSIGLMGLIVGFGIGKWRIGSFPVLTGSPPDRIAQVPTPSPTPQPPAPSGPVPPIDAKTDHIRGDLKKAQVAVVEYSDMECPFCKRVHPTYQQIMQTYGDKVVWVYRHYPLPFHQYAEPAARASECANELGNNDAFWKFIDGVFTLDALSNDAFVTIAKNISLNETKFKSCLDSGKFAQHVKDDMSGGSGAGVNGTPGNFVINLKTQKSQEISGAQPFDSFKTAIDAALQS